MTMFNGIGTKPKITPAIRRVEMGERRKYPRIGEKQIDGTNHSRKSEERQIGNNELRWRSDERARISAEPMANPMHNTKRNSRS